MKKKNIIYSSIATTLLLTNGLTLHYFHKEKLNHIEEITDQRGMYDELDVKYSEALNNISEQKNQITMLKKKTDDLNKKNDTLTSKNSKLKKEVKKQEKTISVLRQELEKTKKRNKESPHP